MSEEKLRRNENAENGQGTDPAAKTQKSGVSETWAEETIADLDEFIESQGIYIRQ